MNLHELNPYVRLAQRSTLSPHHHLLPRVIYDFELIYVESGSTSLSYGEETYLCKSGDVLFLRPNVLHEFCGTGVPFVQPHIHFDAVWDSDSASIPISFKARSQMSPRELAWIRRDVFSGLSPSPILKIPSTERFLKYFFRVVDAPLTPIGLLQRKAAMIDLLSLLPNVWEENAPSPLLSVEERIRDFIDNGQGMAMSLSDFEQQFCYDRFHLERRFRAAYGTGLIAYRNRRRMELALESLQVCSATEVARSLGFSSIYSFSRAFREHHGFPPSQAKVRNN